MKTIGKLAKELDINVETVRFYERKVSVTATTPYNVIAVTLTEVQELYEPAKNPYKNKTTGLN